MPIVNISALSAQHFVTADQYNNMLSAVLAMPLAWNAPSIQDITPVSGRYEVLASVQPSARHNTWLMVNIGPSALVLGDILAGNIDATMAYTLINFQPSLISYISPTLFGTWDHTAANSAFTTDGDTGNPQGQARGWSARSTAQAGNNTYARWDLGAIVTGALFWNIAGKRADIAVAHTAVVALSVSNDATAYTQITAYSATTVAVGTATLSATVPMRFIRVSLHDVQPAASSLSGRIDIGEIAVFTSSGFVNVASGLPTFEFISANISGGLISLYTTAPTPIAMQYVTGWRPWRA